MAPGLERSLQLTREKLRMTMWLTFQLATEIFQLLQCILGRLSTIVNTGLSIMTNALSLCALFSTLLRQQFSAAEMIGSPRILPRIGVAIEPDRDLVVFDRIELIYVEATLPPPLFSTHESCSTSVSYQNLVNAENKFKNTELKQLMDEFGMTETTSKESVKAASWKDSDLYEDAAAKCEDKWECQGEPTVADGALVPCYDFSAQLINNREASLCQRVDPTSVCCSLKNNKCSKSFSSKALRQISQRLAAEEGALMYKMPHREARGDRLVSWCISATSIEDKDTLAILFQRGAAPVSRKRRGAGYWSMGGPFSSAYVDAAVTRVEVEANSDIDELRDQIKTDEDFVFKMSEEVTKVSKLRDQVCTSLEEIQEVELHQSMVEYIDDSRSLVSRSVGQCALGMLPEALDPMRMSIICKTMSSSHKCYNMIQQLAECRSYSIQTNGAGLHFLATIAMSIPLPETDYQAIQLINLGLFLDEFTNQRLIGIPEVAVQLNEKVLEVSRDQCVRRPKGTLCPKSSILNQEMGDESCLNAIIKMLDPKADNNTESVVRATCKTEIRSVAGSCQVDFLASGLLISTGKDVEIIESTADDVSTTRCQSKSMCYVQNPSKGTKVINCNQERLSIGAVFEELIVDKVKFDLPNIELDQLDTTSLTDKFKFTRDLKNSRVVKHFQSRKATYIYIIIIGAVIVLSLCFLRCLASLGLRWKISDLCIGCRNLTCGCCGCGDCCLFDWRKCCTCCKPEESPESMEMAPKAVYCQ